MYDEMHPRPPASLRKPPTKAERAEMERHCRGLLCLDSRNQHRWCGGRLIRDRHKSPDDWQDCTCPCHHWRKEMEHYHAKRG